MEMLRPGYEMKDSGIDWIGQVPQNWKIARLKDIKAASRYAIVDGPFGTAISTDDYVDEGVPLVRITNLVNGRVEFDEMVYIPLSLAEKLHRSQTGLKDIIFAKTGGTVGKCAINDSVERGILSSSCVKISISEDNDFRFFYYFFYSPPFVEALINACTGTTRNTINLKPFSNLNCIVPPLVEQRAIASYLDDRCSRLDDIITEAEKSIEEYKELKQAVIFEAVTKGLNKNSSMKPSNVGWIDYIPSSWNVGKLRLLAEFYNGDRSSRYPSGDDIQSEGIIFVTSNNLGGIRLNIDISTNKYISQEKYDELGGAKLQIDDIVFCLRGSVGKCSINKTFDAGTIASSLVVIRPKKINPDYLNYVLQTSRITDEAIVSAIGIGSANLAAHDISEFFVPVPSKREQQEIANFLDVRVGDMDALISEKQALIEDLKAYKKSLIYEVVTGKRRVV